MPFKSQQQRELFYAMLKDQALRQKHGLSLREVKQMIQHDKGGKLPYVSKKTKESVD